MEPTHNVVIEGLEGGNRKSDYTIRATGDIKQIDGTLEGISVSKGSDEVNNNTVKGTVWSGADGYQIDGGIESIEIEHPDTVQVHIGKADTEIGDDSGGDPVYKTISAQSVEALGGQGPGEGKLELEIEHDSGEKTERDEVKVAPGSTHRLDSDLFSYQLDPGESKNMNIVTRVTEKDEGVGADWFTGQDDFGESRVEITLDSEENAGEFSNTIPVSSDKENPVDIRVNYTIQESFQ